MIRPPCPDPAARASLSARLLACGELRAQDRRALLERARWLRRLSSQGSAHALALLRGRHLAIVDEPPSSCDGQLFELAARQLGARVSRIGTGGLFGDDPAAAHTATRLLPRLYDALECHAVPAACALALQRRTGVPVYRRLCEADHPIRALLPDFIGDDDACPDATPALARLVQAVLLETILSRG